MESESTPIEFPDTEELFRVATELYNIYKNDMENELKEYSANNNRDVINLTIYSNSHTKTMQNYITRIIERYYHIFIKAVFQNDLETIEYLNNTSKINLKDKTYYREDYSNYPLLISIEYGFDDITKYLIENGMDMNIAEGLLVESAIDFQRFDIVEYMIKNGFNLKILGSDAKDEIIYYFTSDSYTI